MRSIAVTRAAVFFVLLGMILWSSSVLSDNVCNCENPPGGAVRCEQGQVAICRIKGGLVYAECKSPPSYVTTAAAFKSWLASDVLKKQINPKDLEKGELKDAFKKRQFDLPTGDVVKFSLPTETEMARQPKKDRDDG